MARKIEEKRLYTVREVADFLDVSTQDVYFLVKKGNIAADRNPLGRQSRGSYKITGKELKRLMCGEEAKTGTIKLKDGRVVDEDDYILAKTKDLILSGFEHLTEEGVKEQLGKIRKGEKLSVIGEFMKDDFTEEAV
jgi:hypothetical protein